MRILEKIILAVKEVTYKVLKIIQVGNFGLGTFI